MRNEYQRLFLVSAIWLKQSENRVKSFYSSIQQFSITSANKYDLIVSNPPFFENDLKSANSNRNLARHNDNLSFSDFLNASRNFIADDGKLSLILPVTEAELFITEASNYHFFLQKKIIILPKPDKAANRCILSFGNNKETIIEDSLCIRNADNSYTDAYRELTSDYYISLK